MMKKQVVWIGVATMGLGLAAEAAVVILPNGNRVEGSEVRARPNGDIVLTTPQGQRTFPRGQYQRAEADKPATYDRAGSLVSQGQFDQAISLLKQIVSEYQYLTWDNNARIALARVYLSQKKPAEAVNVFEELFEADPAYRNDDQVAWAYRSALVDAEQFDKLDQDLERVIAAGSREQAARAQIMRGDAKMKRGLVEQAVMDYLRSAILFESETSVHPEALLKSAQGLEQLRDPRAKELYRKLVETYPQSPQAQQARGKL